MMASALVSIAGFHVHTQPEENLLFSPFLPVFKHLAVDLEELPIFSVFILIPSIPVVNFGFLLLFNYLLVFSESLVWSEIVVVLGVSEQISGHWIN